MPVFQCDVCDPDNPCILPCAAKLAETPDACPWSKDGNIPVWRRLGVVE
jgi:hypothetical protein